MIKESEPLSMGEAIENIDKTSGAETLTFIKKFTILKSNEAKEMRMKLEKLGILKLDSKSISKIIDVLPENSEELNKVFTGLSLDDDESKKVIDIVKEFK